MQASQRGGRSPASSLQHRALCVQGKWDPLSIVFGELGKRNIREKKKSEHKSGHLGQYFTSGEGLALPLFPPLKRAKSGPR